MLQLMGLPTGLISLVLQLLQSPIIFYVEGLVVSTVLWVPRATVGQGHLFSLVCKISHARVGGSTACPIARGFAHECFEIGSVTKGLSMTPFLEDLRLKVTSKLRYFVTKIFAGTESVESHLSIVLQHHIPELSTLAICLQSTLSLYHLLLFQGGWDFVAYILGTTCHATQCLYERACGIPNVKRKQAGNRGAHGKGVSSWAVCSSPHQWKAPNATSWVVCWGCMLLRGIGVPCLNQRPIARAAQSKPRNDKEGLGSTPTGKHALLQHS